MTALSASAGLGSEHARPHHLLLRRDPFPNRDVRAEPDGRQPGATGPGVHPFTPERIHSHQWTLRCSLRAPLACHVCPRLPRVPPLATCAPACRVTRVSLACHVPRVPLVQTIERCITLLFIVDLCLNFNTAYLDGSHYIIHRSLIARNYLMGWFWIDLASSIPFEDLLHLFVLLTGNEEAFSGQPPMASECL